MNLGEKMTKITIQEDAEKIVAYQTKYFQKTPTAKITYYKKTQGENYESALGGAISTNIYFDTELNIDHGPIYLYDSGEFKVTKRLSGVSIMGSYYHFSYAYPFNKEIIKENERAIKAIEDIVNKTIINR
jgi:hypothetical protein